MFVTRHFGTANSVLISKVAELIDTGDFNQVCLINPLFSKFDHCMTTYWMFIISFLATLV